MQDQSVGRDGDVDGIAALIFGESRAVLLEGEAGVGKSAVLAALGRRLESSGRVASRVFGAAGARDLPLAPFSHLMKQWTPGDSPGAVVVELLLVLERRAERDGMVLLVDDVQHLDDVSLAVLHQLVSHGSVPLVVTRRVDDACPTSSKDCAHRGA